MNDGKTPRSEKSKLILTVSVFSAIFILLYTIVNMGEISGLLSKIVTILNPVIIGFIIAYLCNPIYNLLYKKAFAKIRNYKFRKVISIILTYLAIFAIIALLFVIILPQFIAAIEDLISKADRYISTTVVWVTEFIEKTDLLNGDFSKLFDIKLNEVADQLVGIVEKSGSLMKKVGEFIINYGTSIIVSVKDVFFGLLISVYVLAFKNRISVWCKRLLRAFTQRKTYDSFMYRVNHANKKFGSYIIGAITDSMIVTVESLIIFSIFGIPYAPLIAVIVGITNVIPILGPFIGAIPSAFIILITEPSKLLLFIILIVVIQQIDGNIVAPLVLGSSMGLSSFGILLAITIMGGLWGIPGMFIGVPLFAFFADIIDESVNARLRKLDDPEFKPTEGTENDKKSPSPLMQFFKNIFLKIKNLFRKKNKKK